jgi:hypothetical protein
MAHEELSPLNITPGAIRFNTDSMKLEYFRIGSEGGTTSSYAGIGTLAAGEWVQITTDSPDIQTGGTRGVLFGGYTGSALVNIIEYANLDSTGNTIDFGNLGGTQYEGDAFASRTRGVFAGGAPDGTLINYVTIASTGDSVDFGNLQVGAAQLGALSNSTRGIVAGGSPYPAGINRIEYVTIASTGDSVDFGDMINSEPAVNTSASSTRGIIAGGNSPKTDVIQYITISTLGNAADFGDMTVARGGASSASNSIRSIIAGGGSPSADLGSIEYITIATNGNGISFGDLTTATASFTSSGGASSPTRCVFFGRHVSNTYTNTIDYVQIMSTGDAVDFGDLVGGVRNRIGTCSNGHGGLG